MMEVTETFEITNHHARIEPEYRRLMDNDIRMKYQQCRDIIGIEEISEQDVFYIDYHLKTMPLYLDTLRQHKAMILPTPAPGIYKSTNGGGWTWVAGPSQDTPQLPQDAPGEAKPAQVENMPPPEIRPLKIENFEFSSDGKDVKIKAFGYAEQGHPLKLTIER